MRRSSRLAGLVLAAALVVIALAGALLHTPPGRRVVRAAAISWLRAQGIAATIDGLRYNLFTLSVDLTGVRVGAVGAGVPFLTADRIQADLPWRLLTGHLEIESLSLTRPSVHVVRLADGTLNLPDGSGSAGPGPTRVGVGRLELIGLTARYDDDAARQHVAVRDLTVRLGPADGGIRGSIGSGNQLSVRSDGVTGEGTLAGGLRYDGSTVWLDAFQLTSGLGALRLDGRIDVWGGAPRLALAAGATLPLDRLSGVFAVEPPARGTVTLTGRVDGPRTSPSVQVQAHSEEIGWQHLAARRVAVNATATGERVTLTSASLDLGGGTLEARGDYQVAAQRGQLRAAWRDIPASALAGIAEPGLGRLGLNGTAALETALAATPRLLRLDATARATASGTRALDATIALSSDGNAWRARTTLASVDGARMEGRFTGRLASRDIADTSLRGSLTAAIADIPALAGTAARLGLWNHSWPAVDAGTARAQMDVAGTLTSPTARGTLHVAGLRAAGFGPLDATTALSMDAREFAVRDLHATAGGNQLTGSVALARGRDVLAGRLDLAIANFRALGDDTVARWHPAGQLEVHTVLSGTMARPLAAITATGSGLAVAGQDLGTLDAAATASGDAITLSHAEIRQPHGGRLMASGRYALRDDAHALRLEAASVLLSPVWIGARNDLPMAGRLEGMVDVAGPPAQPEGGGRLAITDLQWSDAYLEHLTAGITLAGGNATLDMAAPALALTARAVTSLTEPYETVLTADAIDTDVATAVARAGSFAPAILGELSGRLRAHLTATGAPASLGKATADGRLDGLDVTFRGATIQLDQPATVQYRSGDATIAPLALKTGNARLVLAGGVTDDTLTGVRAQLEGSLQDFRPWMAALGAPDAFEAAGTLALTATATGSLDRPVLAADARLAAGRLQWPETPPVTDVAAALSLRNGVLDVPTVEAAWQGGSLSALARMPLRFLEEWLPAQLVSGTDRRATAHVRLDRLTPGLAAPWIEAATLNDLSGRATMEVDLSAERPELDAVTGTVRIPQLTLLAHGVPVEQTRPTRLELTAGVLRVADWEWTLAGSPLVVAGTAGVVADQPLNLRADGRLDLTVLGLFLPNGAADGTGDLALSLTGTPSAPIAEGTLTLTNAEIQLTEPRIALSGLNGSLLFTPGRIDLRTVSGTLNGGSLSASGGLAYAGTRVTGGRVAITAANVALEVPDGVRSEVNAALNLTADDGVRLTGGVDILRGGYREPLSLAAALALAGRDAAAMLAPAGSGASMLDEVGLNVTVASAEDVIVDNNYGRLALGLDLRLVGTLAQPSVVGRAEIREGGALYLGGRTYLVDRGIIDFTDPRVIEPNLDVTGRTRVNGTDESGAPATYDITLAITGTPATLKTTLTSTPDRSQADLVSLLATGRLADQVGGAGTAVARDQFLGYLSGETLGFAARAIGVDAIRFERGANADDLSSDASLAGEVNPAQRLTVSRRISNTAEVTVSQNLRDTGRQTWIAAFTPGKSIELRALSRDDTSHSYEVRHDLAFGGPPLPAAPARRASGTTVVAVRILGDTVIPLKEIEQQLRLTAGVRFDFLRWQADRDRLRRLYVRHGYREVRISARQVPATAGSGAPGVTLEYQITAHAPTVIEIDGTDVPDSVRREIERIWDESILDVGLVAEVDAAVRAHLAGEGFLRARVRVQRIPATTEDPRTRLRVRVAPGPRIATREFAITGNTLVSTADITAIAERRGPGIWLAPGPLADEVLDQYRRRGRLAASVTAGPPVFNGDRAVLPVRIDEGPAFGVGRITVTGAVSRSEAAARRDLGLAAGTAFTPDLLPGARQTLVSAYAADGYNGTNVAIATTVDTAASLVHLDVRVDEGVQQVVADVSVTGAEGVATGVVTRALQVTPGMPADLEQLYIGRRRLFQTGLFRRADVDIEPIAGIDAPAGLEPVRANVTLLRGNPWRARYGVSVTDELAPVAERGRTFGGGANVALERQGLFGRPGSGVVSFRYNNDQQVARGSVAWPTLFGRAISSRVYASRSRDSVSGADILSFVTDRTTFTAEQRVTMGARTQLSYAYQLERNHVFAPDADPSDPFALDERWRQGRLSAAFVFDSRSDLTEPGGGFLHSSTVEYGLESLGRNGRFIKYSLQELHFVPFGTRVVSASAVRLNAGRGFGGQDLILSERFLAGGTNTVRGYADDGLAGFDFFGDPIAGQATLVLNQEARVTLGKFIRAVGFVDAGQVFPRAADFSFGSLQWSAGGGLRVRTPVGLFRFDVAAPVPSGGLPIRYHFGFGHMF